MNSQIAIGLIFGTPFVAVLGGVIVSILKVRGQHRLLELAQRERMAAIDKGLDISQFPLPALPAPFGALSARQLALRRAQGLVIGGMVTLALGIGLSAMLILLPASDGRDAWPAGIVPASIGVALLLSARIVRKTIDE